jgi:hypothetical protein
MGSPYTVVTVALFCSRSEIRYRTSGTFIVLSLGAFLSPR